MKRRSVIGILMMGMAALVLSENKSLAQVSGAIFTTDDACIGTDLNIYKFKQDVYLDGGPRKTGSAGLPPGKYYVQVTSPSGVLLGTSIGSSDPTPAIVNEFGELETCYRLCEILINPTANNKNNGNGNSCGYADTPNPGGVYKVWISQESTFANSHSKTDNFKVKKGRETPLTEIRAKKFYDTDANQQQDEFEPLISDWLIELRLKSDDSLIGCQLTSSGEVRFLVDQDGTEYVVREVPPNPGFYPHGDYLNTTPVSVDVVADQAVRNVQFGNVCLLEDTADFDTKGYWHNKNGITELISDAGFFVEVMSYVNALAPYSSPSGYFGKGDEPFNGVDALDAPVPAGKGILNNQDIADAGTIEAEISNFLIDSIGNGGIREQLAQQLLAFIFNTFYALDGPDTMIMLDAETVEPASNIISDAIAAWSSIDSGQQNSMASLLDAFNNNDDVWFVRVAPGPCEFEPVSCYP